MMMQMPMRKIEDITLANLKNGEVTLVELDEIYKQMGFVFEVSKGRFTRIKKEIKH